MAITDSVANFVDRIRADMAQQEYWNAQAALNSLQNQPTSDPSVVRRIEEESKAQQDAVMRYASLTERQGQRERGGPTLKAKTEEQLMGERGGGALRPVTREMPDMSKGNYGAPLTEEEKMQYAAEAPPKVVSRKQFKSEAEWQNWLASKRGESPAADDSGLLGEPQGQQVYNQEAQAQPRQAQGDFVQASNQGGVNALDVNDMGFGKLPSQKKAPWQILQELEQSGRPADAQHFRYQLEQEDYKYNMAQLQQQATIVAQTQGAKAAKDLVELYLPLIREQAKTKPVEESAYFKDAQEYINNADTRKTTNLLRTFSDELATAQRMLNRGVDKGEVNRFLAANVPKIINFMSTMSTDALQPAEVARIASELQGYADSGLSFNEWIKSAANRGIFNAAFKSPQDFITKANRIYNAAARSINKQFDDVKGQYGAVVFDRLGLESRKFQLRAEDTGGMPTRQGLMERGAAAPTTPPAGAVRKSVSIQSVYPQ